jgi:hypothetical protein
VGPLLITAAIRVTYELPARFLDDRGERAGFVLLAAFLLAFLFIRTARPREAGCIYITWCGASC